MRCSKFFVRVHWKPLHHNAVYERCICDSLEYGIAFVQGISKRPDCELVFGVEFLSMN